VLCPPVQRILRILICSSVSWHFTVLPCSRGKQRGLRAMILKLVFTCAPFWDSNHASFNSLKLQNIPPILAKSEQWLFWMCFLNLYTPPPSPNWPCPGIGSLTPGLPSSVTNLWSSKSGTDMQYVKDKSVTMFSFLRETQMVHHETIKCSATALLRIYHSQCCHLTYKMTN